MCGINGILDFNNRLDQQEIILMNKLLKHRGPDGSDYLRYKNLLLGHTRLAIQDLSDKGSQPMTNDEKFWIVFNGEIYNYKDIKEELIKKGYKFKSNTDTEVILNSFKEWGIDCFHRFNGMWALAILDTTKNELLLCRDRYGVKPCYIFYHKSKFIFSSEIKPILKITGAQLDKNKILLHEHTKEGLFTTDFENINILQPGHFIRINLFNQSIKKERWWNGLNYVPKISQNKNEIIQELKEKLTNAIKTRLVSDVPISTSLSGGIDSSIIFSELCEIGDANIDLNPFIVNYEKNLTYKFAINLANSKSKNPYVVEGDEDISINKIMDTYSSLEQKQYYSKQIKLYESQNKYGYKVSIDGHGADECLGGYVDNIKDFAIAFQNNLVKSYTAINKISSSNLDTVIENNYLKKHNQIINIDLSVIMNTEISSKYIELNKLENFNESFNDDLKDLSNFDFSYQSQYLKSNYGFLQWLLNKWDRASMRNTVEIRSPFLDYNFFQYALSIPTHFKISEGVNKSILREAYLKKIPSEIISFQDKQGLPEDDLHLYENVIIENTIHEKDFLESHLWDSKKIISDINNNDLGINQRKEIIEILKTYIFEKSMRKTL